MSSFGNPGTSEGGSGTHLEMSMARDNASPRPPSYTRQHTNGIPCEDVAMGGTTHHGGGQERKKHDIIWQSGHF